MVVSRTCKAIRSEGQPCRAAPLKDEHYCRFHSPGAAEEVQEGRRLGGQRRRRERVVAAVYDFEGLGSVASIRRLVEVAATDTLGLENSVARNRTLGSLAQIAASLVEKGELDARLAALESVVLLGRARKR